MVEQTQDHLTQKRRTIMNTTTINFNNVAYAEASLSELSGPALVELYNEVLSTFRNGGAVPNVRRFADKTTAVTRTWKVLQRYAEAHTEVETEAQAEPQKVETVDETTTPAPVAAPKAQEAPKSAEEKKAPRARKGTNLLPPGGRTVPCREGSKQAILLDMLARPNGATMAELIRLRIMLLPLEAAKSMAASWVSTVARSCMTWFMIVDETLIAASEPSRRRLAPGSSWPLSPTRKITPRSARTKRNMLARILFSSVVRSRSRQISRDSSCERRSRS